MTMGTSCEAQVPEIDGGPFTDNGDGTFTGTVVAGPSVTFEESGGMVVDLDIKDLVATPTDGTCSPRTPCSFHVKLTLACLYHDGAESGLPNVSIANPWTGNRQSTTPSNVVPGGVDWGSCDYVFEWDWAPPDCGAGSTRTIDFGTGSNGLAPQVGPPGTWSETEGTNVGSVDIKFACDPCGTGGGE